MHKVAVAVYLLASFAFSNQFARAQTDAIPLSVEGHGFSVAELRSGGIAYANRKYVWEDVPSEIEGWNFTKIRGGEPAAITANGVREGFVYIAVDSSMREVSNGILGWEVVPNLSFTLTDHKRTNYAVYRARHSPGVTIPIPQFPWGGLVLSPGLTRIGAEPTGATTVVIGAPTGRTAIVVPGGVDEIVIHPHREPRHVVRYRQTRRVAIRHTAAAHRSTIVRHPHVSRPPIKAGLQIRR